jgi:hypothetical protein
VFGEGLPRPVGLILTKLKYVPNAKSGNIVTGSSKMRLPNTRRCFAPYQFRERMKSPGMCPNYWMPMMEHQAVEALARILPIGGIEPATSDHSRQVGIAWGIRLIV